MESDNSDDWVDPELAQKILEADRTGDWSEDMTAEELLAKIEKMGQTIH
ncbi:hypothetical protein LMG23992_02258 [Cupriavidus laharis]|uniref:Uncharacterized protein n=1 Tax=Cupriavidus laharis TaxID=151654 RepID=A0ABM8WY89_9BURK|nr:hypothetical protein [Cupriavidus laharis]CAG9172524.1 hypothetical protein LMG23992_02258 [Cupriavidus laharis]